MTRYYRVMLKILILTILAIQPLFYTYALEKIAPGENNTAAAISESANLTDEQRYESTSYVHEGLSFRQATEACEKLKDPSACEGRGSTKFLGIDSNMVQGIAKAYSMFSGMSGATGGKLAGGAKSTGEGPQSKGVNDYCAYIPMAGEQMASFVQKADQDKIQSTPVSSQNAQKERLYQAARSHGTRAKTAKMQGTVWGATVGCYGFLMASGKAALNKKIILKAGAAGLLTAFWLNESKQQKKYEKEVKEIADSLPGAGDCNPHTETHCYCSQPETRYDPQYCIDPLRERQNQDPSKVAYEVPCTSASGENDPKCLCIGEDNCMDKTLFSNMNFPGLTNFASSKAGSDTRNLLRGTISAANLNSNESGQKLALRKSLKNIENLVPETSSSPSANQISQSKDLEKMGLSPKLARHLALTSSNSFGQSKAASLSRPQTSSKFATTNRSTTGSSQVLSFSGGRKNIGAKRKRANSNRSVANMMKRYGKSKRSPSSSKVLTFSQRAQRRASIHRKSDRPLFEIISRRYRISAKKHLRVEK